MVRSHWNPLFRHPKRTPPKRAQRASEGSARKQRALSWSCAPALAELRRGTEEIGRKQGTLLGALDRVLSMQASVLGEICFDADWYDYDTKYSEGKSHTVIPAAVQKDLSEKARSMAIAACRAVAAEGLARVDFFLDRNSGALWLNEINTLPGFTSQSMYPMLWHASGLPLEELVHQLVQLAQESHASASSGRAQAA